MTLRSYLLSTASKQALGLDSHWIARVALAIARTITYTTFFATPSGLASREELTLSQAGGLPVNENSNQGETTL